jgi:hypothetical protein
LIQVPQNAVSFSAKRMSPHGELYDQTRRGFANRPFEFHKRGQNFTGPQNVGYWGALPGHIITVSYPRGHFEWKPLYARSAGEQKNP